MASMGKKTRASVDWALKAGMFGGRWHEKEKPEDQSNMKKQYSNKELRQPYHSQEEVNYVTESAASC